MPEGDTIYRAARTLHRALAGRTVTRFESPLPALTRIDEDAPLAGRTVERVWAQGKHLLVALSGNLLLHTHMRMNGSWHIYRPGERWRRPRSRMRVALHTAAFVAVGFDVPVAELIEGKALGRTRSLASLGPDLLADTFAEEEAVARMRARDALAIGEALLDQRAVAGIGNVYKSETCFVARVDPFAPVSSLSDARLRALLATGRRLLQANTSESSHAGIVTYRSLAGGGAGPARGAAHWVYGRKGKPCRRCGAPIQARRQGPDARTTYWCPRCQLESVTGTTGSSER
jgi:endonuclease-8